MSTETTACPHCDNGECSICKPEVDFGLSVTFFDQGSNREMKYVYLASKSSWAGWLLYKHPHSGDWVSLRKATEDDIKRINKAVVEAHHA